MRGLLNAAGMAGIVVAAIVLGALPPVVALSAWMEAHRLPLLTGLGVMLAVGFALFFGSILKLLMDRGEALEHSQARDVERSVRMEARPVFSRATKYRVAGAAAGRSGAESFTLRELKAAWRSGVLWRDAEWRRRGVAVLGALLLVVGGLGVGIVVGPPWVKVLLAGMLLYAFARLAGGWRRA
jgi:hypothetical protein